MKINKSSVQPNQIPGMLSGANMGGTGNSTSGSSFAMDIRDMEQGQIFQGVITKIAGGEVTIQVGQEFLQARFEESVNLCVGETLNFMIKSNDKNKIYIKPLPTNSNPVDNTMYKALKAANLPPNDRNIDIVSNLLLNSMPVDKKTIVSLITASLQNKEVEIADLVRMKKFDFNLDRDMVEQFINYKENHHQLKNQIAEIEHEFPAVLVKMAEVMEGKELAHILLSFLIENSEIHADQPIPSEQLKNLSELIRDAGNQKAADFFYSFANCIAKENYDKEALVSFLKGSLFANMVKEQIQTNWSLPPEHFTKHHAEDFFEMLYGQAKNLSDIADKTGEETALHKPSAFSAIQESLHSFSASLKQIQSNLSFMEQLNKHFVYLQMPLRLKNQIAHSDIYVYTRKKTRNPEKEGLSLLLHLDMEKLGKLDVFVTLFGTSLNAAFTLSDKEAAELIQTHVGFLSDQLEKKGFSFTSDVKHRKKEKPTDFIEEFLEKDETTVKITRYSFDVRT